MDEDPPKVGVVFGEFKIGTGHRDASLRDALPIELISRAKYVLL